MGLISAASKVVEFAPVPDLLTRAGIEMLCGRTARHLRHADAAVEAEFAKAMGAGPIAEHTQAANEQHYEVPAEFFRLVLGPHRKYSCCHYDSSTASLASAEERALRLTAEHAQLADGQDILELGCGWGSLSLFMAQAYPNARITAVSNSHSQREFIEHEAGLRQIRNLKVVTCDMNQFRTDASYDRIVSVEMFEHMRNWRELFHKVHGWLKPSGLFFMHIFVHRTLPYLFTVEDDSDWMSRYFFSGGMMPSDDLALHCQDDLRLLRRWRWDGTHYQRTAEAWLRNLDDSRASLWPLFERTYGVDADVWWMRWRLFFMSVAELFGHDEGRQWWVSHYLFEKRA